MIYNTTYSVPNKDARNFVIWIREKMIPIIENDGVLKDPKILRILNHHDQDTECFSLQFFVKDSAELHRWTIRQGRTMNEEMKKMFSSKIHGFSTLMEEI